MSGNFPLLHQSPRASLLVAHFRASTAVTLTAPTHLSSISNLTAAPFNSCTAESTHSLSPHHCDKLCSTTNQRAGSPVLPDYKYTRFRALMCIHSTKQHYSNNAFFQAVPWRLAALNAVAGHNLLADLASGITSWRSLSLHHCMAGTSVRLHTLAPTSLQHALSD